MTVNYILPQAPSPHADESFPGFVMRTAAAYRFRDPRRLFRRLKPPSVTLWTLCQENPEGVLGDRMRRLLGLDQETFRRLSMWTPDDTTISVLGTPVWLELVRHTSRVVCPLCLQESNHHRAAWLVDALPVCPTHEVWLHDRCIGPNCRRPLTWAGFDNHRCGNQRCRQDLRKASVEHVDPAILGGLRSLHGLLHGIGDTPIGMPVGDTIKMAFILGQIAFGFGRATRPPGFIQREMRRMPMIMEAGWQALDDWPNGFHRLLARLQARASERAGKEGLRKAFGNLSSRVYDWAREPWGTPIGVAFAEYAAAQPTLATTSRTLRRYAPGAEIRHLHVSVAQAQQALGISPGMMMAIATRRRMFVLPPRGMGAPSLLRADAVRSLQDELKDFLMPDEARLVLGVGRKVMLQLEAAGLIRRVPADGRIMESRPYRRSEVEAFVTACIGSGRKMDKATAKAAEFTPLTRWAAASRQVSDVCQALLDGRLRSAATVTDARGLMRLRLRMDDLDRVLPAGRETMSMEDAAPSMGCKYNHLGIWARKGLLKTVGATRRGEKGQRIEHDVWDQFRRDYITGGELAHLAGQEGSTWLSRHLRFLGVEPVSGPGIDDSKLCLFRRADCGSEVMEAIRRAQARPSGTAQEKRRVALARGVQVADVVAARWSTKLERENNRFADARTGRTLQVVSGRRPDLTGVFKFSLQQTSLTSLRSTDDAWVALVPFGLDTFILAPLDRIPWRGETLKAAYVTLRFDGQGRPLDMVEWACSLSSPSSTSVAVLSNGVPRSRTSGSPSRSTDPSATT